MFDYGTMGIVTSRRLRPQPLPCRWRGKPWSIMPVSVDRLALDRQHVAALIAIVVCGLALSVPLFLLARDYERRQSERAFVEQAASHAASLTNTLASSTEVVRSIRSFFDASREVERNEFDAFTRNVLNMRPEIKVLAWAPRITPGEIPSLAAAAKADGIDGFGIVEVNTTGGLDDAAFRHEYFPLFYAEPSEPDNALLGLDLAVRGECRTAMERARDQGIVALTAPVNFGIGVLDSPTIVAFVPTYRTRNVPLTVEDRRAQLQGFAVGAFVTAKIVGNVYRAPLVEAATIRVDDITDPANPVRLFTHLPADNGAVAVEQPMGLTAFVWETEVQARERQWRATYALPSGPLTGASWMSWSLFLATLTLIALGAAYALALLRQSAQVRLEVAQRTAELNSTLEALRTSEGRLREFVSIASHELRTPLTTVLGYTELLLHREVPSETQRSWLEESYKGGQRLSAIIEDILNISRIQSGRLHFTQVAVNVAEAVSSAVSVIAPTTGKHTLLVEVRDGIPPILVDPGKFQQILLNLLTNAVKYSPNGGPITVAADFRTEDRHVVVRVTDCGIGIASEDRAQLFTTFYRVHRPEVEMVRGTGLGLYIVKSLVDLMDGRVWVESEVGIGSSFYVSLPAVVEG